MDQELISLRRRPEPAPKSVAIWGTGFRSFFLAGALFGMLPVAFWIDQYLVGWTSIRSWAPASWHAHEMVFGFAAAIVLGFLLTAVPKWTATRPVSGAPLALLFAAWTLGRLGMLLSDLLSPIAVIASACLVYPLAVALIGRAILRTRNRRNYAFVLLLSLLGLCDLASQLANFELAGLKPAHTSIALRVGLYVVVMMVVIVGGRVLPGFSNAALKRAQREGQVEAAPRWEYFVEAVVALTLFGMVISAPKELVITGLAGSALALSLRVRRHRPLLARGIPLLWALHIGYAWLPIGFACLLFARLGMGIAESTALHALSAGGIGTMILAMISRVALGHTGRELAAPRGMPTAFVLVIAAGATRVFGPMVLPQHYAGVIVTSATLWLLAFGTFVLCYARVLVFQRADGRPG